MMEDNGLEVLLQLLRDGKYAIPEGLLRECYAVQKQYQHDRDREVPLNQMRRLVEAQAADQLASGSTEEE